MLEKIIIMVRRLVRWTEEQLKVKSLKNGKATGKMSKSEAEFAIDQIWILCNMSSENIVVCPLLPNLGFWM